MALLSVKNLTYSYPDGEAVFPPLSFEIARGELCVLAGRTGCGKSTLMRLLKPGLVQSGECAGQILFDGAPLSSLPSLDCARRIGYVTQRPEQQIVTDRVFSELAFAPECLGWEKDLIRRRVAETADYFGLGSILGAPTATLSGGQKQLLNLASVMITDPDLLLLDEPTAQLDPIAAERFTDTVCKLNRETGLTVIVIEHRPEALLARASRLLVLGEDGIAVSDVPERAVPLAIERVPALAGAMPAASILAHALFRDETPFPLSVRSGREMLERRVIPTVRSLPEKEQSAGGQVVLSVKDLYFRYGRKEEDVLSGVSFDVRAGEVFCLLGGNGSGKSTLLSVIAGLKRPVLGAVRVFGKKTTDHAPGELYRSCLALLPQDVQTTFLRSTVREECSGTDLSSLPFDLSGLADRHPYDLSGGEQQMLGLAVLLGRDPRLLLLDEPTKGLDAEERDHFVSILRALAREGKTVVCVTHDPEFAARAADRCAMLFGGRILSVSPPRAFFGGNSFYTTSAVRTSKGFFENVLTADDLIGLCERNGRREE